MCGIIGSTNKLDAFVLEKLRHRGPDDSGLFEDQNIYLGHTRLSIIDVQHGSQPISNENGSIVMVYNGEIYNFIELREELKKKNVNFRTSSDSEVLLKMYENYGLDQTLKKINGMFAFALFDKVQNKLYLVRDRVGIKPVFYCLKSGLSFCSELTPLRDLCGKENLTIDHEALSIFFNTYYIPSPYTIWNEIRSLEPGHYVSYDFKKKISQKTCYWQLQKFCRDWNDISSFEETFEDAVRIRMRSEVPYGAYLSGGIDSSLVVKYMSKYDDCVKTYTAEIDDDFLNEKEYATNVSNKFKTQYNGMQISDKHVDIDLLFKLINHFGQPFADSSIIPTYLISKAISEKVTVALSGDGADELFAGYDKYTNHGILSDRFFRNNNVDFLKHNFNSYNLLLKHLPYVPKDQKELLRLLDIRFFLEGDILQKVDRTSMANSLEVRTPFLDYRIIQMSQMLNSNTLFNVTKKKILKDLIRKNFGDSFVDRPKVGFMLDINKWTYRFNSYLTQFDFKKTRLFNDNFDISKVNDGYLRFAFLMFVLWWKNEVANG